MLLITPFAIREVGLDPVFTTVIDALSIAPRLLVISMVEPTIDAVIPVMF